MSKRQLLSILGIWIMIFLYLGFPSNWEIILALVTGVVIIAIAYNLPSQNDPSDDENQNDGTFVENK